MSYRVTDNDGLERTTNLPALANSTYIYWFRMQVDRDDFSATWGIEDGNNNVFNETSNDGVSLFCLGDGFSPTQYSPEVDLVVGEWRVVTWTFDGSKFPSSRTRRLQDTAWSTFSDTVAASAMTTPSLIQYGRFESNSEHLNGDLGVFKIWSAALTEEECEAEAQQITPVRLADLDAFYPCFSGGSERLRDYGPNGENLSVFGQSALADADMPPLPWGGRILVRRRIVSAGQTVAVGQAAETDLAQPATPSRLKDVVQAQETDLAQIIDPARLAAVVQAIETDTALTIDISVALQADQAIETDLAQPVSPARLTDVVQAQETDLSEPITPAEIQPIGQAVETDSAQPVLFFRSLLINQTGETDLALPIVSPSSINVGQAQETDLAQPIAGGRGLDIGQSTESDTALAIISAKIVAIVQATETDLAQITTPFKIHIIEVGQAQETDVAPIVTPIQIFAPGSISDLELHLDATFSDFDPSQWNDISSNLRHVVQATEANQPVLIFEKGRNVVEFVAANSENMRWSGTAFGGDAFTVAIVCEFPVGALQTGFAETWASASDGVGNSENVGFRGRAGEIASVANWNMRVGDPFIQLTEPQGAAEGDKVWAIYRSDGASPTGTLEHENSGGNTDSLTYTDASVPLSEVAVNAALFGANVSSHGDIKIDVLLIYSKDVVGAELTNLIDWLDNRIGQQVFIGQALETDTALDVRPVKNIAVGQAVETDTALTIAPTAALVVAVNQALEIDLALPVDAIDTEAIGVGLEVDTSLAIIPARLLDVGQALESCQVFPITIRLPTEIPLQQVLESDQALTVIVVGGEAPPLRDSGAGTAAPGLDLPQMVPTKIRQSQQALARDDEELLTTIIPVIADSMLRSDQ